jgi:hypothetical protein
VDQLVRITVSPDKVPADKIVVGGIRVVPKTTDEQLGREIRTVDVFVSSEEQAADLREYIKRTEGLSEA